ncbi:hypothetical protein [Streptomyces montanus]|uniref:hypothetical protein n=1 Tax=Streptomyces montanus TaxID=2580423 RepID=UPI001FE45731|nr:hypothetical protein [Streptomyces montanus]
MSRRRRGHAATACRGGAVAAWGKPAVLTPEGDWDQSHPGLGFDVESDRVVLLAEPQIS